ncbi:hypothetical protein AK812_SmicGene8339 [Symbiodinium microadriaticum]|uniref:Uncharacterized protein n=1 Tax=Symbiodinium microadriaticum TaxID=2951 RepID=A0A1Q9ELA4_SYMMI|nr:hypothetical protein AK812_SmicGene8339 [Symbiodinium microadriaticum]
MTTSAHAFVICWKTEDLKGFAHLCLQLEDADLKLEDANFRAKPEVDSSGADGCPGPRGADPREGFEETISTAVREKNYGPGKE